MSVHDWIGGTDGTWNTAANWDPASGGAGAGGVPGAGDTIRLNGRATRALTGNPTSSPQLARIEQYRNCAYAFGTPSAPIAVCADVIEIGLESPDAQSVTPGEFHINTGTNAGSKLFVYQTATQGASDVEPVTFKTGTPGSGSHALHVQGGIVGLASAAPGDAATIADITVSGSGRVNASSGLVWTNAKALGNSILNLRSGSSGTLTVGQPERGGGTVRTEGTALIATALVYGGTWYPNHRVSGAECTDVTLDGGTIDLTEDAEAFAITNDPAFRKGTLKRLYATQWAPTPSLSTTNPDVTIS